MLLTTDETSIIALYLDTDRDTTAAAIQAVIPYIDDEAMKQLVTDTAMKVAAMSVKDFKDIDFSLALIDDQT
ncbi:transposon-transfer assisting family protein [Enterocloster bolteae]|uniref:transposon-transfer assisting family protein n=1 Tax=Enterocloster bolteae TaxID=208479 RepID=UPI002A829010|nr:transposon-transfer assisting family protein [Enterocloster bolteae]MBS5632617.1 hypothetical protein [Clostridiales bacterium]